MTPLIVFIHIPKTGGTSIRVAAAEYFGAEKLLYDYGPDARMTSALVREWIYEKEDLDGFTERVADGDYRFFTGHFPLGKYHQILPQAQYVSWLREPVARAWSAYLHHRGRQRFRGTFEEFYRQRRFWNQQVRMLGGNLDRMDFVGVLEHFQLSLSRLNERYGIRLVQHRANKRLPLFRQSPDERQSAELAKRNLRDAQLYQLAVKTLLHGPRPRTELDSAI